MAAVHLDSTPQWELLQGLAEGRLLTQRELVAMLRRDLAGCLESPALLNAIRKISFRSEVRGSGAIEHGRESLGRQVEAEVAGVAESIPELVTLRVPRYLNTGECHQQWRIDCDLEIDVAAQRFAFQPLPGQMERADREHQADIRARLEAELGELLVYAGTY